MSVSASPLDGPSTTMPIRAVSGPASVAAPVARLLNLARPQRRVPFYPQEIERFRMELEMKRATNDLTYRFKVM